MAPSAFWFRWNRWESIKRCQSIVILIIISLGTWEKKFEQILQCEDDEKIWKGWCWFNLQFNWKKKLLKSFVETSETFTLQATSIIDNFTNWLGNRFNFIKENYLKCYNCSRHLKKTKKVENWRFQLRLKSMNLRLK